MGVNGVSGGSDKLLTAILASNELDLILLSPPQNKDSDSDDMSSDGSNDSDGELCVTLEKHESHGLGISFYHSVNALKITKVKTGAVNEWNTANPDRSIAAGHAIVEVNGRSGTAQELLDAIH